MMNHQGGLGRFHSNANIQNEVNLRDSIGALEIFSSSSSHTGSVQRFPDRLSRTNFLPYQESVNILPINDRNAGVLPHNLDLNAEYVGNNHCTNQNVSVGLCLHPVKPDGLEDQSDSNSSDSMTIDSGDWGYVVHEQGVDSSSVNVMCLSCNKSPEHACRELLTGESSGTAVQARIPILQGATSQVNANNSLNISAPYTGPATIHPQQFEAGFGYGTTRQVYDMQHFSHARQLGNFQSNNHLQTAVNPQAFVPPSLLSMGHGRNSHVLLPSQPPLFHQYDHLPFFSPVQNPVGANPLLQPFVHVPNFHETLQASPWGDIMGPRRVPPSFLPIHTGGETVDPFYNQRNIMLGPQTRRGIWAHNVTNLSFANGTANILGNFAHPSQYGSFSGIHLSNAPTWVPGFNFCEQHVHMFSGVGNHSAVAPNGFPGQSSHSPSELGPSAVSQEMNFSIIFRNARFQNQHRTVPRSENQSSGNPEPPFMSWSPDTAEARSSLMPDTAEARSSLMTEAQNASEYLPNGGSLRLEELLILDYSLLLYLLEEHINHEDSDLDEENMSYEENWQFDTGLTEEAILMHLRQEKLQSTTAKIPANDESCCICQEDYVDCEDIGVLDCGHRFHFHCIKQWLTIKNTCPICI